MTTQQQWRRNVELAIPGAIFDSNFRISFSVRKEYNSGSSNARVGVYNLTRARENSLLEASENAIATVKAGYGNDLHQLFTGNMQDVNIDDIGLDRIATIRVSPGEVKGGGNNPISMMSYPGMASVREVATRFADDLGLSIEQLSDLPDAQVTNWVWGVDQLVGADNVAGKPRYDMVGCRRPDQNGAKGYAATQHGGAAYHIGRYRHGGPALSQERRRRT